MLESPQSLQGKESRIREKYFKPSILSDLGKKSQTYFWQGKVFITGNLQHD